MATLAIAALVGTIALGIVVGLLYLQRVRKPKLVTAHLVMALASTALVLALLVTAPGGATAGPPAVLPLAILAIATAGGYFAKRVARRSRPGSRQGAEAMLFSHVVLGLAGFLVFLAWVRHI
jgi:hypothetical protein